MSVHVEMVFSIPIKYIEMIENMDKNFLIKSKHQVIKTEIKINCLFNHILVWKIKQLLTNSIYENLHKLPVGIVINITLPYFSYQSAAQLLSNINLYLFIYKSLLFKWWRKKRVLEVCSKTWINPGFDKKSVEVLVS